MLARLKNSLGLERAVVVQALGLALSAWLAFAIASWLRIPHAFWAAMPIWVVAQTRRGVMLERGLFRILGTLLGAGVGFGLMHLPVSPYLQLALMGAWMALAAGLSHVLRGVHGYGALLAGLTASIVVLPSVLHGEVALETAASRVVCTLIGVVVVTLVMGLLTPAESLPHFFQRVRVLCADAVSLAARLLRDEGDLSEAERELLGELSALDASARLVTAGSIEGYRRVALVDALVAASLSVVSGALILRGRVRQGRRAMDEALLASLEHLAGHLRSESPTELSQRELTVRADEADPATRRFAAAVGQLIAAEKALFDRQEVAAGRAAPTRVPHLLPHREWALALRSGLTTGGVAFGATAVAYASAQPSSELVALGVCIFSMVLGSMAVPQLIAPKLWLGIGTGVCAALVYRLGLQPHISTLPELLVSVAPFMLLGGLLRAAPRTRMMAIDFNMAFLLSSVAVLPTVVDPAGAWSGAVALFVAATVVAGTFMLVPRRSGRQALEAAQALRWDVRRLIERTWAPTEAGWRARTARQLLRLTLHLGRAEELGLRMPTGSLAVLGVGHAIADLHEAAPAHAAASPVAKVLAEAQALLGDAVERPVETAASVRRLAEAAGASTLSRMLLDLAWALEQAAGVLTFGVSRPPGTPGAAR